MEKSNEGRGQQKLRVMTDANTLFSSVYLPRFDFEILQHSINGDIIIVISPYIFLQARRAIIKHIPDRLSLLDLRLAISTKEIVQDPTPQEISEARAINLVRDLTDIPIALSAKNAQVDYLITRDKDFTAEDETTKEIRKWIKIIKPRPFLEEVMDWSKEALDQLAKRTWEDLELKEKKS